MPDGTNLPKRSDAPVEQTWDKSSVYASDAEWEVALRDATRAIPNLGRFRGRLDESASITLEALQTRDEWQALIWRIRWYAAMRSIQMRFLRLPKPQVKRGEYPA